MDYQHLDRVGAMDSNRITDMLAQQLEEEDMPMSWVDIDIDGNPLHPEDDLYDSKADIDSRSINQETTKKHWEQQFASCDVTLFPRPQEPGRKSVSSSDISEFKSEVETESIGNLSAVKKAWEQKAIELQKEKEERERHISSSKSFDNLSTSKTYETQSLPMSKSYDSFKTVSTPRHMNNNHIYSSYGEVDAVDNNERNESAIEREIRLAQEREDELRRDHEARFSDVSEKTVIISENETEKDTGLDFSPKKSPPSVQVVEVHTKTHTVRSPSPIVSAVQSPPLASESHGVIYDERRKKESIIEREIREQQEKEQQLRHEGQLRNFRHSNKEHEQSEYERQEKEHERINAHESIVEREIRLQREREQDLQRLRHIVYREPSQTSPASDEPRTEFTEESPRTPEVFDSPEETLDQPSMPPEPVHISNKPYTTKTSRPSTLSPSHTRDMANPVPYEEAISTYAHAGESLIARELREQKEREEELHRRWREELGLESPLKPCEPDTPYNMPEPVQPRMQLNKGSAYQREIKPYKDISAHILVPPGGGVRRTSVDSQSSSRSAASNSAEASHPTATRHKIQSFKTEDDDRDVYHYVPQYETPIEREIRIAREREEEFRQMKGIVNVTSEKTKEVPFETKQPSPRPQVLYRKGDDVSPEMSTMKWLAHSRLQQEIQKEKERELDLQRDGHISTTSEDHKGEGHRYIEIIPKDASPMAPAPVKTPTTPKTSSIVRTPTAMLTQQAVVTTPTPNPTPEIVKHVQNGSVSNGNAVKTQVSHEHLMTRRVTKAHEERGRRSMAEYKIEQELQEMREREEELRNQREVLSHRLVPAGEQTTNGDTNGGATSSLQEEVHHRPVFSAPGDQLSKGPRRKSTLAEEWERKISEYA